MSNETTSVLPDGRFLRPQASSLAGAAALAALSGLLALLVPLVAGWAVEASGLGRGLRT